MYGKKRKYVGKYKRLIFFFFQFLSKTTQSLKQNMTLCCGVYNTCRSKNM